MKKNKVDLHVMIDSEQKEFMVEYAWSNRKSYGHVVRELLHYAIQVYEKNMGKKNASK